MAKVDWIRDSIELMNRHLFTYSNSNTMQNDDSRLSSNSIYTYRLDFSYIFNGMPKDMINTLQYPNKQYSRGDLVNY